MGEGPHILEEVGTVSALHILHHHAEMLPALKAAVHRDDEWIVGEGEDVSFSKDLLNLQGLFGLISKYILIFHCLHKPGFSRLSCVC